MASVDLPKMEKAEYALSHHHTQLLTDPTVRAQR